MAAFFFTAFFFTAFLAAFFFTAFFAVFFLAAFFFTAFFAVFFLAAFFFTAFFAVFLAALRTTFLAAFFFTAFLAAFFRTAFLVVFFAAFLRATFLTAMCTLLGRQSGLLIEAKATLAPSQGISEAAKFCKGKICLRVSFSLRLKLALQRLQSPAPAGNSPRATSSCTCSTLGVSEFTPRKTRWARFQGASCLR